jgi:hypothetical protein
MYRTACIIFDRIHERAVEENTMFSDIKPTAVKAGRPSVLQSARDATAVRRQNVSRGLHAAAQTSLPAAHPSASGRLGTAIAFVLGLALAAGGAAMLGRIWANLAMIR